MSWCGYIDMLGTRDMASRSAAELIRNLDFFHGTLSENFEHFADGQCSAFSDGAFFVASDVTAFQPFFVRVRNMLFQRGLFFRCSFIEGTIPMIDNETDATGKYLSDHRPAFRSFTFSGAAPSAYQRESTFKGIGCTIANAVGRERPQKTVASFYLKTDGGRIVISEYTDFAFMPFELAEPEGSVSSDTAKARTYDEEQPIVDQTILACHTALTQSAKVGSYFIPALVAMIRSDSLHGIGFELERREWTNTPYLFKQLIDGGATKALKDLPGLHLLLLACYDKLYRDCDGTPPKAVQSKVLSRLMRHPSCFRNLDTVPDFVITGSARTELVKLRAAATLQPTKRSRSSAPQPE